jgi:hypothetical protein
MRIISGGQSGVDRAALDAAIALGIAYGGWCPKGGWAEDFPRPPGVLTRYPLLVETPSADPAERTRWNVRDTDATLILIDRSGIAASNGTRLAHVVADEYAKPQIVIDLSASDSAKRTIDWLGAVRPNKLGIGGPRESEAPGIYKTARAFLVAVLGEAGASRL